MRSVVDLVESLKDRYGGVLSFKKICEEEGVIAAKAKLEDGLNGFSISSNARRVIVVNERLSYDERRDWAWHELYHILRGTAGQDRRASKREERAADLFAALCKIPVVREGDTVDMIVERYSVSRRLACIRIDFELKRSAA
ncbi:MAG: ImmA/IrrE family metallo-endopeptidase [Bacteroidota bacterium]